MSCRIAIPTWRWRAEPLLMGKRCAVEALASNRALLAATTSDSAPGAEGEPRRLVSIVPRGAREAEVQGCRPHVRAHGRASSALRSICLRRQSHRQEERWCRSRRIVSSDAADRRSSSTRERSPMREKSWSSLRVSSRRSERSIACVEVATPEKKRHRLAFEVRSKPHGTAGVIAPPRIRSRSLPPSAHTRAEASAAIEQVFGKGRCGRQAAHRQGSRPRARARARRTRDLEPRSRAITFRRDHRGQRRAAPLARSRADLLDARRLHPSARIR